MKKSKKILISPLDWGLGHTTRIVPLVKKYKAEGSIVTVACNSFQKQILENELSDINFIDLSGYNIKFSTSKSQLLTILFQIPKLLKSIKRENSFVASFINNNKVDLIISDNRYGFRNNKVKSVIITHQTYIKTPLIIKCFEQLLNIINTKQINKFAECWVPDIEGDGNLAGELSNKNKRIKNLKFIGVLSRFKKLEESGKTNNVLAIISGPEPQRTLFEDIIIKKLTKENGKSIIVRGTNNKIKSNTDKIEFINVASSSKLQELISKSEYIISRSGYSSIMDYYKLGVKAILVPTPGQTEQEYLAKYLSQKHGFFYVEQAKLCN